MLDKLTSEMFVPYVNQRFLIHYGDAESIQVELISTTELDADATEDDHQLGRIPFSLVFQSAPSDSYLRQAMYKVEHTDLGALEIFLVPIGSDEHGVRYEAVFA